MSRGWLSLLAAFTVVASGIDCAAGATTVIAHRGASGYLPEHTLAGYAYAYAQGADYLEPDVVITRDGHAIALHDLYLDAVTDVRERFPGRARGDGLNYVVDFTLQELRSLAVSERIDPATGEQRFAARFPVGSGQFRIVTLAELIELTQGLNHSTGRVVGIYPELKAPAFHEAHGHDITAIVLVILDRYGYRSAQDPCLIQSFEPEPLKRLRKEFGTELRLVQLLGENDWAMNAVDYEPMYTRDGLATIATYADAIGPPVTRILLGVDATGAPRLSSLVGDAHAAGLLVHPYTFRADTLHEGYSLEALLELFVQRLGVDGLFIDHPDRLVRLLEQGRAR